MIHGNGKPIKISKMLDPMELETAMSPFPCIATMILLSKSGTLVPAASNVNPMTTEGIRHTQPMTVASHTMKYANTAIHAIDIKNVTMKNFSKRALVTFGIVRYNGIISGRDTMYNIFAWQFSSGQGGKHKFPSF